MGERVIAGVKEGGEVAGRGEARHGARGARESYEASGNSTA
jgi:hypothetical protein